MKINREQEKSSSTKQEKAQPSRRVPVPEQPQRRAYDVAQDGGFEDPEPYEEEEEVVVRKKRRFPVGLVIVLVVLALVAVAGWQMMQFYSEVDGHGSVGQEVTVSVEQGSSVADIAAVLKQNNIIKYDWLFKLYTKYSGRASGLQYGDFQVHAGMSYNDIITTLSEQKVFRDTVRVTIPEGTTAVGIAQIFVDQGLVDSVDTFLNCAEGKDGSDFSQYEFWNEIPDNEGRLLKCEGYLFPDTYEFYSDASVYDIVDRLYSEFDTKTSGLMSTIEEKGTTLDQVVILASFIQEEAGLASEDAKVSACFHNRLESDDPLWAEHKLESNASSDIMQDGDNNYLWNSPMAEYMGWPQEGAIPEEVLNAYDTYRISGLPAGAISNPGIDAIEAALNPDEEFLNEGYFFFVTGNPSGDYPGQYFYAKTADEHYQNCEKAGWPQG